MSAKYSNISFKPPAGAVSEAKKGLAWRKEHGRGGTSVGIARARDISGGKEMSPETVKRMKAFFDRHQSDKKAEGWSPGEAGYPSNGRIAHALWGGDAGYSWSKKVVSQMEAADKRGSADDLDIRMVDTAPTLEVRSDENGKTVIRGVAALYNSESRDLGGFTEVLLPGAFDRAMSDPNLDVFAKLDHERVLGRSISGTLELSLTERGLEYVIHPKKTDADVVEALERGDLRGSSFAFRIAQGGDKWEQRSDGVTVRTISDIEFLGDVSVVHTPAYPETDNKVFLSSRTLEAAKAEFESREHPVLTDAEEVDAEDAALVPEPRSEEPEVEAVEEPAVDARLAAAREAVRMLDRMEKDRQVRELIARLRG